MTSKHLVDFLLLSRQYFTLPCLGLFATLRDFTITAPYLCRFSSLPSFPSRSRSNQSHLLAHPRPPVPLLTSVLFNSYHYIICLTFFRMISSPIRVYPSIRGFNIPAGA